MGRKALPAKARKKPLKVSLDSDVYARATSSANASAWVNEACKAHIKNEGNEREDMTERKGNGRGDSVAKMVNQLMGRTVITEGMAGDESAGAAVDTIPSGILALDMALGIGGLPRGRITEVFGAEGVGKTIVGHRMLAAAQASGGVAALIDADHSFDPTAARRRGVNVESLLVSQPDSCEQALEIVDLLVRSQSVGLILVDSTFGLTPREEIDGPLLDSNLSGRARLMAQAMRTLADRARRSPTAIVFLSRSVTRLGLGASSEMSSTSGGDALKTYAVLRVMLSVAGAVSKGRNGPANWRLLLSAEKNHFAEANEARVDVQSDIGIDPVLDVLRTAIAHGVVSVGEAEMVSFAGMELGIGLAAARSWLNDHPKMVSQIEKAVRTKVKEAQPEEGVNSLKPGQKIEVKVDGRPYQTHIDEQGIQRFVSLGLGGKLASLPFAGDLNQVCVEFIRGFRAGRYTMQDYQEFNMSLGYSVSGFADCMSSLTLNSGIPDTQIENPVWDKE